MACTAEFIDFVLGALSPLGETRTRKMMGDYVIYLNEKSVITACDDNAFIKKLPCISALMADAEVGCAYPGAKEGYILSFDDQDKARKVISTLWEALPFPKPKKKSTSKR